MNENVEELHDVLESGDATENIGEEIGTGTEETGEEYPEVSETFEQGDEIGADGEDIESVSNVDSDLTEYDARLDDIIEELVYQREQMDSFQAYIESKDLTLFEKPLEKYTVQEGISLLIFFLLLFVVLFKLVGGIITCKV